jgi:hypothetical protein
MIKDQLLKESSMTYKESMHVLEEFEKIVLGNEAI